MPDLVPLPGSDRSELSGASAAAPLDGDQVITVTVLLRRRAEVPRALVEGPQTISTSELGDRYGADPADAQLVSEVLGSYGLTVTETHLASRRLMVSGTIAAMQAAFGTTLSAVTSPHPDGSGDVQHRYRTGSLSVPARLTGVITAVLGLDDRPQARAQFRRGPSSGARAAADKEDGTGAAAPAVPAAKGGPLTAPQVASFYQFPAGTDGTGQTVAIIELGGGYTPSDLSTYFSGLGLAVPSVTAVGVDGASNSPGQEADGEVELDIGVVGGVAPGAVQVVYFAANTDQGFIDAISQAVHATPAPVAVSISWGQSEDQWSAQSRTAMDEAFADAAALGATVTVAAGDNGSSDDPSTQSGVHADFPASSPNALACGGTRLIGNTSSFAITSEVVWNELASNEGAGGGGISDVFPLPSYQANAGVPTSAGGGTAGRGVPDVAGNADPETGYQVTVDGESAVFGGTSAVAPLYLGLYLRLLELTKTPFDLVATVAANATVCFDVTSGTNGGFRAGPGRDEATGFGVVDGTRLLTVLQTGTVTPPPPPPPPTGDTNPDDVALAKAAKTWLAAKKLS
jgi:kumamolisin